jgi:hypothetical protein
MSEYVFAMNSKSNSQPKPRSGKSKKPTSKPLTDRGRVSRAFAALRRKGYSAQTDFFCCRPCGWNAVPDDQADKAVFYDACQRESVFEDSRTLSYPLWLSWSGDPAEIINTIAAHRLIAHWSGDPDHCIAVLTQKFIDSMKPGDPLLDDIYKKYRGDEKKEGKEDPNSGRVGQQWDR